MKKFISKTFVALVLTSVVSVAAMAAGGKCIALGRVGGEDVACAKHQTAEDCNERNDNRREICLWEAAPVKYTKRASVLLVKTLAHGIEVELSAGYTNKAGRCEEGETLCLTIEGIGRIADEAYLVTDTSNPSCTFLVSLKEKRAKISNVSDGCTVGTAQRGLAREISGVYKTK